MRATTEGVTRGLIVAVVSLSLMLSACLSKAQLDRSESLSGTTSAHGVQVSEVPVRGFLARVSFASFEGQGDFLHLEGELIAVDHRMIWLRVTDDDNCLLALDLSQIANVEVYDVYDANADVVALWSTLGLLSTLSHGFVLVMTAWTWILPGAVLVSRAATASDLEVDESHQLPQLYQFARFPQGVPAAWRMRPQCRLEGR